MSVYVNNGGVGTYGGQVWGEGSDANDGLSRDFPKLTGNAGLDLYALAAQDGTDLIFAPGAYSYTNNDGRWIYSHAVSNIQPDVDWSVLLTFDGINSQGLRHNGSTTEMPNCTIGRIYITTANVLKTVQVVFSHNNAASLLTTVNWYARLIPQGGIIEFGLLFNDSNIDFTVFDGGTFGDSSGGFRDFGTVGTYKPISYSQSTIQVHTNIDIQKWVCNVRIPLATGAGIIYLDTDNEVTSGNWVVKGLTGKFVDSGTTAGGTYAVIFENAPDGHIIEENNDLDFSSDNTNRSVSGWQSRAPAAISAPNGRIRNNKRLRLHSASGAGFLAVFGAEGGDNLCPDGWIYGNSFVVTTTLVNTIHGICHIGCLNGLRFLNEVNGASIGSLTKLATAKSFRNKYRNVTGSSETYLYGKGAEDGTEFSNEICYLPDNYAGNVLQALKDPDTPQDSLNTAFKDIVVLMESGTPNAAMRLAITGGAADISNSTMEGILVDDNVDLSGVTNLAQIAGVELTTFALWNAEASVTAALQAAGVQESVDTIPDIMQIPGLGIVQTGRGTRL